MVSWSRAAVVPLMALLVLGGVSRDVSRTVAIPQAIPDLPGDLPIVGGHPADSPITQGWVNQQLQAWQAYSPYTGGYSELATRPSYGGIFANSQAAVQAELQMLSSTKAGAIRLDINFDPWLMNNQTAIAKYDGYVSSITTTGHKLVIGDAAAESYRKNKLVWSDFESAWLNRAAVLAARYHPDYYIVVKEPPWYFPMILGSPALVPSGSDFGALAQQLADTVRNVSPNTRVGFSVLGQVYRMDRPISLDALTYVARSTNLDFIGFDIYTVGGFNDSASFLSNVGSQGKSVWIAEAWSGDGSAIRDSSRSQLDASWLKLLSYFATKIGANMIEPFYTDLFSGYVVPTGTSNLVAFYQGRTPVYDEFCKMVQGSP